MINPLSQTNVKPRSNLSETKSDPLDQSLTRDLGGINA